MDRWTAERIADQSGRTFIVTGANSGLGFETARQLAAHGGRVVLAARSEPKGRDAVARLKAAQPDAAVEFRSRRPAVTAEYYRQAAPTLYTADEAAGILRMKKSWLERQAAARKNVCS